jgi:toxin CptA
MHSAPSVSYPVGRCRFAGALMLAAWCAGAVALAAWAWQLPSSGARQALGACVLAVVGAAAALSWRRQATGLLAWDGTLWRWADGSGERTGRIAIALDLQAWLLLRWQGEASGGLWLWLERGREPQAWDSLRRAVYSRARIATPAGAPPSHDNT